MPVFVFIRDVSCPSAVLGMQMKLLYKRRVLPPEVWSVHGSARSGGAVPLPQRWAGCLHSVPCMQVQNCLQQPSCRHTGRCRQREQFIRCASLHLAL